MTDSEDLNVKSSALNVERSGSTAAVDPQNPWPGLASFTEEARAFFYGRDEEIAELSRRVQRKLLTILFGQSGLGKTSILRAGVVPKLRNEGYCPVYVRIDYGRESPSPSEQIKQAVITATASAGTWTKPGVSKPDETLWEFLHHRDDVLRDAAGRTLTPLIIFDQFEEIFTLAQGDDFGRERAAQFKEDLADLVENRAPKALEAKLERDDTVVEQFDFARADYRLLISLREDYLPHLDTLKGAMPSITQNRMRLARMTGTQALEAVVKPGGALVTAEVARAIVEFVSGARGGSIERLAEIDVEPPLLSVICRELNERRRALGQPQITAEMVTGNRREILTDFYERSMTDLPEGMRAFVEDHLLTKSGFRDNLALETALEFPGVTRPLIDTLVSRRLLRIEDRLGIQRVELTHDVLAEVIRASRDSRQQRLAVEQLRRRERLTRRRMWLARIIAAGLLVGLTGVSWIAWRAIRAERDQARLREDAEKLRTAADSARARESKLRSEAEAQEMSARRRAYGSDMNALQSALANDNLGRARELLNRHRPTERETDLRGWEWRYLWQFCQSDARSVLNEPDGNEIMSISVSSDGQWAAVGNYRGGGARIWNIATKQQIRVAEGGGYIRVAFSPTEPVLAIAMSRPRGSAALPAANVLLWDLNSRQIVRELEAGEGYANGLFYSDDGQNLVVSAGSRTAATVSVWRVADGTKVASWARGIGSTNTGSSWFAVNRQASLAAVATDSTRLSVIDLKTGSEIWNAVATDDSIKCISFSPDGRLLATGAGFVDATIRLWDVSSGRLVGRLEGHRGWMSGLIFLADGKRLVSSSADQTLRLWDVETRTVLRTFRGHKTEVHSIGLLPDQRTMISGCKDGSVYVWDLEAERGAASSGSIVMPLGYWVFADDGAGIVHVNREGVVTRLSGRMFQEKRALLEMGALASTFRTGIEDIIMDTSRPLIAAVNAAGKVQVWDWAQRVLVREWEGGEGNASIIPRHFAAKGTKLIVTSRASGDAGTSYREWDIATGREGRTITFPAVALGNGPTFIYSNDDRETIVLAFADGHGVRRNFITGASAPLKLDILQMGYAAYSPDDKFVAVTSQFGYARVFEAATFREVATLGGFKFGVHSAEFSPDMQRLTLGSTASEAVTIWDAHNFERLLTLEARASVLHPTQFSPDGNVVMTRTGAGARAGTLYFWRAPSWAEIENAERTAAAKPQ